MRALDLRVKVHGWSVVQVGDEHAAFSYTVGLVENFGHPDLIVLDVDRAYQYALINEIAKGIATTGRPALDRPLTEGVRCREVHTNHLTSEYFAMWATRYGGLPRPGQMMQVVLPDRAFCACHKHAVRRLDRPYSTPTVQLNRAQRRSRGRGAA